MRKSKKNKQHNGQKKKIEKDKQRSTKHTHKTEDRVTRTPLKTKSELGCSRRVSSFCSKCDTRCVTLACKPCDKSWIRKGSGCDYDEQNISVVYMLRCLVCCRSGRIICQSRRTFIWHNWSHHYESVTAATMTLLTIMEYLCHKSPRICSVRRNHNLILSLFMIYHRVCKLE
jgi:hypothetical protein